MIETDGQAQEHRCSGRGRAQVQAVGRAVHIVENVVHAGLDTPDPLFGMTQVVTGRDAPDLVSFAIAVVLIEAGRRHAAVEAGAQPVVRRETVVPRNEKIALVVRGSVDRDLPHPVVLGVVLVRFRIEPAVAQAEGPFTQVVADVQVHAKRLGVVHVLVLACFDRVVGNDVLRGGILEE